MQVLFLFNLLCSKINNEKSFYFSRSGVSESRNGKEIYDNFRIARDVFEEIRMKVYRKTCPILFLMDHKNY